jgi:hypothetical protein
LCYLFGSGTFEVISNLEYYFLYEERREEKREEGGGRS